MLRPTVRRCLDAGAFNVIPAMLKDAVAAGVGATLATMPFVAFHFGRVSVVGLPATLVATPLVSAAIPGLLSAIGMSWISPPFAHFLAGGTDVLLRSLEWVARLCASPSWATLWVGDAVLIGSLVGGLGCLIVMRFLREGVRGWARWMTIMVWAVTGCRSGSARRAMGRFGHGGDRFPRRWPGGRLGHPIPRRALDSGRHGPTGTNVRRWCTCGPPVSTPPGSGGDRGSCVDPSGSGSHRWSRSGRPGARRGVCVGPRPGDRKGRLCTGPGGGKP